MNICLLTPSPVPFVMGGAEKLFLGLVEAINRHSSHVADLIKIPVFEQGFWGIIDGYQRFAQLDLSHFDAVISTKYPAWMIRHPNHHVYIQHKLRGFYDLYQVAPQGLEQRCRPALPKPMPDHPALDPILAILERPQPDRADMDELFAELERIRPLRLPEQVCAFPGPLIRAIVHFLDSVGLAPAEVASYAAISRTVATRDNYFPANQPVRVLHHPTSLRGLTPCPGGDYLFTASRLAELKRVHLLIEAYAQVPGDTPFLIAGTGAESFALERQAAQDPRVQFLGFVPDDHLVRLYQEALAVPFIPYDEDYGLITIEAMHAGKPVLTCTDSGGVTEMVRSGINGEVVAPCVADIAAGLTRLVTDRERTITLGHKAAESVATLTWPHFVRDLLEHVSIPRAARSTAMSHGKKDRIVVLSTFRIHPPIQGGQQRIAHLYRQLAEHYQVTIVSLGALNSAEERRVEGLDYMEHRVPRTKAQSREELRLEDETGISCGDVMATTLWAQNHRFMDALSEHLQDACCVVLSHPYLVHALDGLWDGPVIYDAHNVEQDLKRPYLQDHADIFALVCQAEAAAVARASLVIACSEQDRARLCQLYDLDQSLTCVIENGVCPVAPFDERALVRLRRRMGLGERPLAVFMGSMHGPNVDAVRHIFALAKARPAWSFAIMGSVQAAFREQAHPDNLVFVDQLPDTQKSLLLAAATLGLNPITTGSGTNMKVLDYAAHGLPILSTPFGLRGLELDERHALVHELTNFGSAMDKAVRDPAQTKALALAARNLVQRRYEWKVLGQEFGTRLETVL
ncbi:MAG: glycosyltransferase [Desulfovibrionales bacterium]|nr:glycosyltransferase [Desulfovibrionales bacterium]